MCGSLQEQRRPHGTPRHNRAGQFCLYKMVKIVKVVNTILEMIVMAAGGIDDACDSFFQDAFRMAEFALKKKEVPVGCVVVYEERVIARGCNEVNLTKNATRHAELVAIDHLIEYCKKNSLPMEKVCCSATIYVTVEPCIMCAFALRTVGLVDVLYGCSNDRFGGCGSVLDVSRGCGDSKLPELKARSVKLANVAEKAMGLLQEFYKGANPNTQF